MPKVGIETAHFLRTHILGAAAVVSMVAFLGSCSRPLEAPKPVSMGESVSNDASGIPLAVPAGASNSVDAAVPAKASAKAASIYRGTGNLINTAPSARQTTSANSDDEITLNFVNADVKDVARAVLGDYLKLNYSVGANVQGAITIQTSRGLPRRAVLSALEQALRMNNLALVRSDDFYKIMPVGEAPRQFGRPELVSKETRSAPGFGTMIVPLKYIGAQEMRRVLEPIAPAGSILEVDQVRNVLVLAGTEQERSTLLDEIALFDVDWLSGMSFALLTPKVVDAKTLANELGQVIGGRNSPLSGIVRLIPIERINSVLAISTQPKYLDALQTWVDRLDRSTETDEQRVHVYYVQNGRATDLANVLNKVLAGANSQGAGSLGPLNLPQAPDVMIQQPSSASTGRSTSGPRDAQQDPSRPGGASPAGPDADAPDYSGAGINVKALANIHITADETNNALLVLATAHEYEIVEEALRKLDIPPLQVLLEAAVAEVTLTNELRYGVQYFAQTGEHQFLQTNTTTGVIAPTLPGFAYIFSSSSNIQVILSALESITDVNVVSAPKLLVLNNQTATLQVGDQVPVATQSAVAVQGSGSPVVNSIQYKDTGVILKVIPRVNESGVVLMDVTQEVSDVTPTTTSTLDSPTIQQRKISSTVVIQDGETVALGGLIKDGRTKTKNGIPILQNIPVVGNLFKTTDNSGTRTELLVLITPHVVQGVQRARAITQELRRKMSATSPLFEGAK